MSKFKKFFMRNLSILQNYLIVILCLTVIVEISHLWFINLANGQSLFENSNKAAVQSGVQNSFLEPERFLRSVDYNTFFVSYNGYAYDNSYEVVQDIILNVANEGEFIDIGEFTYDMLNNEGLVILDYSYTIDGKMVQEAFNTQKNVYSKVKDFDKIYISFENELINMYFVDSVQNIYYYYTLKDSYLYKSIIVATSSIDSQTTYSYVFDDSSIAQNNELIANIDSSYLYNKVIITNPFQTEYGDSPRNLVESKVKKYFKNILYMEFLPSDTAYVFSDTNTVVKYFNNGFLEYSYYNVSASNVEYSVVESYAVAKTFLEDDDIENEYRLKNYYKNNMETVFEFEYVANNYPVIIESTDGLTDVAITVVVKNNIVTNYKKIVHNFEVSSDTLSASKSFESAINIFAAPTDQKLIKNISLGYKASEQSDEMTLYWFMNAFDSKTSLSTY